jgi:Mn-containing catalase
VGARGPAKYRDVLLNTATEEISHIEMLATAVALNLENAPATMQETTLQANPVVGTVMGGGERPRHVVEGMLQRHILSTGMAAFPANSDGLPFDCSHVYASGNLAADMYCNVAAEATGRTLAVRLYNSTSDPGMQDMLSYLIARDSMHQQQWLAVIEDMGKDVLPIPNSFDRSKEATEFSYMFMGTERHAASIQPGRYCEGPSLDGQGDFNFRAGFEPFGEEPVLGPARPDSGAQLEQMDSPPVTNALA